MQKEVHLVLLDLVCV